MFFKKNNKLKNIHFYKYSRVLKKFKLKAEIKNKNFFKSFDFKKKLFFFLKENRLLIKDLFFHKFVKQKTVTKFFFNLKKFNVNKLINFFEFSLFNIVIQSNFLIFKKDVLFFLKNDFIFVNGSCIKNNFYQIKVGDRVQIVLNKNYYFYLKNFNKILKNLTSKIKLNIRKNFSKKKDFYKQKSQRTPN